MSAVLVNVPDASGGGELIVVPVPKGIVSEVFAAGGAINGVMTRVEVAALPAFDLIELVVAVEFVFCIGFEFVDAPKAVVGFVVAENEFFHPGGGVVDAVPPNALKPTKAVYGDILVPTVLEGRGGGIEVSHLCIGLGIGGFDDPREAGVEILNGRVGISGEPKMLRTGEVVIHSVGIAIAGDHFPSVGVFEAVEAEVVFVAGFVTIEHGGGGGFIHRSAVGLAVRGYLAEGAVGEADLVPHGAGAAVTGGEVEPALLVIGT